MKDKLAELDQKIEGHCVNTSRYDETMYNLGVEMGRLLERESIASHRPQVFQNFNQNNLLHTAKEAEYTRIKDYLAFIVRNAVGAQIDAYGAFCFAASMNSQDLLSDDIVEKYHCQIYRSRNTTDTHFVVHVDFVGQVEDALKLGKLPSRADIDLENTTGNDEEILYKGNDVKKFMDLSLNVRVASYEEYELKAAADELEKIQFFLTMNTANIR
jgi:hypothetical protein